MSRLDYLIADEIARINYDSRSRISIPKTSARSVQRKGKEGAFESNIGRTGKAKEKKEDRSCSH